MRSSSAILIALVFCISAANAAHTGKVTTEAGLPLNIRSSPNIQAGIMGTLAAGSSVDIQCSLNSQVVSGVQGTTAVWYKLTKGGYVSAAFVSASSIPHCGAPFTARVNVKSGLPLNVRSGPHTGSGVVGSIPVNAEFQVDCQVNGDNISGDSRTTSVWYHVPSKGGYVSGAFVNNNGKTAPTCSKTPTPPSPARDCSAGLKNPRTCAEAVAWAEAHKTDYYNPEYAGMCDHVVGLAYGRPYSGFNSALIHWQTTPAQFKHYDRNPPPGALVFFGQPPFGHATISTGGGNIISTDIPRPGALGKTTIDFIDRVHRNPYLGWTNPYFHNA